MDASTLWILAGASFGTALLSAVVGLAGGMTLLAVMLLFYDPWVVLPIHGAIQLISNLARSFFQRRHIETWILGRFSILLVPAALLGLYVGRELPAEATKVAIGVFVLVATWQPRWLFFGAHPESIEPGTRFLAMGGVVGFLNMTVGATGPFSAPFFLNLDLSRHAMVGTKAATQALGHTVKIALFAAAGFAFARYALPLLVLALCTVAGTWAGSRILDRVSEATFTHLYRAVLTLIALRLVGAPLVRAIGG